MIRRRVLPLLLAVLLVAPVAAWAGMFDDDEARSRIEALRADFAALTHRLEVAMKNQIESANQAEVLRAELARLRGQIEVMANDLENTQKRQRDFYVDLDSRLRKLETAAAPAAPVAAAGEAKPEGGIPKTDPAQETRDYEAALAAFKGARYKEANTAFQAFIKAYPSSGLLPNAYYWSASCHYQSKEFAKAAEVFAKVAATWPNDPKAADALLAQSNALGEGGDAKGARKILESLIALYPASSAAQVGKQRLKTR